MSMVSKSSVTGAGDGLVPAKKRRPPVASCRRFATRGVEADPAVRRRLREALETFAAPPEGPLGKRSLSVAEIGKKTDPTRKHKSLEVHESAGSSRMADAGRRVTHQLVLNAWRRRRRQAASLAESRDRLQTQVEQLQMQVDVLQKLREAEGSRRTEAVCENRTFLAEIGSLEQQIANLQENMAEKEARECGLKETAEKLGVDLMNERNNVKTMAHQKSLCEQAYNRERQHLQSLREERNRLLHRIEQCEQDISTEQSNAKSLKDVIKMTENKYVESRNQYDELKENCAKLEGLNELCKVEKREVEDLLRGAKSKGDRLEAKIRDLKKQVCGCKQQKKKLVEENEGLLVSVAGLEGYIREQQQKQWWKSTGEFVYSSLLRTAELLFPALPPAAKADFVKCSISLGTL